MISYITLYVEVAFCVHSQRNTNAKCNIEDDPNAILRQVDDSVFTNFFNCFLIDLNACCNLLLFQFI